MRVLTEIGNPSLPSFAALIISRISFGFLIIAAPAYCFSIDLSGQPIFISIPSKPNSLQSADAFLILSGFDPNICATIGRSFSEYFKSIKSFSRAIGCAKPSADTNSVKKISGLPYLAMICLKTQSVTSAIGARHKIGFLSFFQKFFIIRKCRVKNSLKLRPGSQKEREPTLFKNSLHGTSLIEFVIYLVSKAKVDVFERRVFTL